MDSTVQRVSKGVSAQTKNEHFRKLSVNVQKKPVVHMDSMNQLTVGLD